MTLDPKLEPVLDWQDIQGNILAGFNKDHQMLGGFRLGTDVFKNKSFVSFLSKRVTSLKEIVPHKAARANYLQQFGVEPEDLKATWTAVAFSYKGLQALTPEASAFTDVEFREGLPKSASRLGDPLNSAGETDFSEWVIGSPGNIPDVLVIVAADDPEELVETFRVIRQSAESLGIEKIYEETGHDLSYYSDEQHLFPKGHEHFGFKDGVSQPGVRGVFPTGESLTKRVEPVDPNDSGPEYAEKGKPLVCAGQFVLGYAQQIDYAARQPGAPRPLGAQPNSVGPTWAANGSFLVFRRLRQDVAGFYEFIAENASAIGRADLAAGRLAAMLVGRWPSGAPIIRASTHDDPHSADPSLVNAFAYGDDNEPLNLPNDSEGLVCPVAAHIRKVNPRDGDTDIGQASAALTKRILRRGIPYGPPVRPGMADESFVDRGLLFLSYQSSIANQFEFLCSRWMNSASLPRNPSNHLEGLGFDMIVGQQQFGRIRSAYLRFAPSGAIDIPVTNQSANLKDWVIPTGGGYFFAPSISAISTILGS